MAMPNLTVRNVAPTASRVHRRPQHPFQVRTRPWQIAPFFIAPVLPGETMQHLLLQSRTVTDPVKSKLIGWWNEYYFYYVKHRDLDGRDDFSQMMLDPSQSLATYNQAAAAYYYHSQTTISWVKECLKRVVEWDFRLEGEAWDTYKVGDLPAAQINSRTVFDSATNDGDMPAPADADVDLNSDSTITAREIDEAMRQWQLLSSQGLTTASYEDYLATFGVRPAKAEVHAPELIRYVRDWQYPSNTVDPTDGSVASAVSWKQTESASKHRYFAEPGFLFGVTVSRPKVYLSKQVGTATDFMTDLYKWLPAILRDDVHTSWTKIDAFDAFFGGNGSSTGTSDAVWIDLKDLFMYGEQFVNFALTETDAGMVALPTAGLQKRYASGTDADALFASASPANQVRQDGVVQLDIMSTVQDTSGTT